MLQFIASFEVNTLKFKRLLAWSYLGAPSGSHLTRSVQRRPCISLISAVAAVDRGERRREVHKRTDR
jgi:hypothetical protein